MNRPMSKDDELYMENLKRELHYDVASGLLKPLDVYPILAGGQEYLQLRRRVIEALAHGREWLQTTSRPARRFRYYLYKWRVSMRVKNHFSPEKIMNEFTSLDYVCDETIAEAVYLALLLKKPLLVEGEPGVGKTEIAKVLAKMLNTQLIRLQCYEGLDESKALYEWNYQKQLLYIQGKDKAAEDVFAEEFLMVRPLLKAILAEDPAPVLLIDEIDKADEEFEAFLLEVLSDFQVSIPEFGTVKAKTIPYIVITNNDARELTNALKRRCIFLYIDYPTVEKEEKILLHRVPGIDKELAHQVAELMNALRKRTDLVKKPSIAEGIDFAQALTMEGITTVDDKVVDRLLPALLKTKEDITAFRKRGEGKWIGGF